MPNEITTPPTEIEIAKAINLEIDSEEMKMLLRRMAFERDRYRQLIAHIELHSVCCDARHMCSDFLKGYHMKTLLLAACLVLSAIVCVPAAAQCSGGSCSLPGRLVVRSAVSIRAVSVRPFRRLGRCR